MRTIQTTHVGSLPRGPELVPLLIARDHGAPYDTDAFDRIVEGAVLDAVERQEASGVSIVSDGELGKVGYSTYMTERLSGFGGDVKRKPALDLAALPELRKKLAAIMGEQEFIRRSCVGPVRLVNLQPCLDDIRRFQNVLRGRNVKGFMNAASPGLITAFQPNAYYPSHEAYLADLVAAMKPEYEAIAAAGFQLQLDCPDLAMARHTGFQDMSEEEFLKTAAANVEALNAATANIPAEQLRMHICWGNYEGPHDHDIPLEKVIDTILSARPSMVLFEAANPRHEHEWTVWAQAKIPDGKVLAPGVIDTCSNYVEHPQLIAQRLARYVDIVGVERVVASTDCGFGTFAGYGKIDPAVTWKKLSMLREGADIAARLQQVASQDSYAEIKPMQLKRAGSQPSTQGPADFFTGNVRIDPLNIAPEPARVSCASVTFEPGARSAWHTHPLGQTLVVTAGCGWTRCEGGPIVEIRAGDVVWCPPGHKHWHGATPTTAMTHIAIQESLNGRNVDWLEKVTDEEYLAGPPRSA